MRYFIVRYLRRPTGGMDEETSVSRRLRNSDVQTAAVILDFKTQTVLQAQLDGKVIERDWQRIHDYYHQHYATVFHQLHANHGRVPANDAGSA
jgi:hypothetical protein